jgi:type III pantothenate kinase
MNVRCLAIELGNTRGKAALFGDPSEALPNQPPEPIGDTVVWRATDAPPWDRLAAISPGERGLVALGGSRPADVARLVATWRDVAPVSLRDATVRPLRSHLDIGVPLAVDVPERVGWDRLLAARAALAARSSSPHLVVVSVGTATTVDLVSRGVFQGGAILPGIDLGGRALRDHTQALPLVQPGREALSGSPIPATGRNTEAAITSGLVWGQLGAISELVRRQTALLDEEFDLWLTGGAAALLVEHLQMIRQPIRCVPHLALSGLALTAWAGKSQ